MSRENLPCDVQKPWDTCTTYSKFYKEPGSMKYAMDTSRRNDNSMPSLSQRMGTLMSNSTNNTDMYRNNNNNNAYII